MQQFLRASTYMLPVSMVLAHIYQPYNVCMAMFFCYLFQHGLFIWKLFLVISILPVTSFKWLFFFLSRAKTQVMHNMFCCVLPSKHMSLLTGSPEFVHTSHENADWRDSPTVNVYSYSWSHVASLLQANCPYWIYLGLGPFVIIFCPCPDEHYIFGRRHRILVILFLNKR